MAKISGKVIVLGNSGVGKSATVMRYVQNTFTKGIPSTVGCSVFTRNVNVQDTEVALQIWDTAGEEKFKAMTRQYFRNANAAILLFDVTSKASFESLHSWLQELRDVVDEPMVLVVVANKIDLSEKREVTRAQAVGYSKNISAYYLECSALTDEGVGEIFTKIAAGLVKLNVNNNEDNNKSATGRVTLTVTDAAKINISIQSTEQVQSVGWKCC